MAKNRNVTINKANGEYLAYDFKIQLPDPTNNEEQNVKHPIGPVELNTEVISPFDGGDAYRNINMKNVTYFPSLRRFTRTTAEKPLA